MAKSYEMDMCNGPILGKVLTYSIPLMLSGVLQLLFNAADVIVVGRFAGSQSLAAVGSTSSLINLLINVFIGLSIGANVLVARYYGAKNDRDMSETIHTAITVSLMSGLFLVFLGLFTSRFWLELMGTPDDVIDKSTIYMRIYFAGMPATMVYNFGSAILRAIGDTKRPLYFLTVAGVINAALNVFFVTQLQMDVAGVALATVISQCISAFLVIRCLMRSEGAMKLSLSRLGVNRRKLLLIIKVGLPAGIQGRFCDLQRTDSVVCQFLRFDRDGRQHGIAEYRGICVYLDECAVPDQFKLYEPEYRSGEIYADQKDLATCQGVVVTVGLVLGFAAYLGGPWLLQVYSEDCRRYFLWTAPVSIICTTYFLCGVMDTMVGSIRGLGYSILPTLVSLTGACGLRVIWIFTIFAAQRSLAILYLSYPISWAVTATAHMICFWRAAKKMPKEDGHPVRG